MIHYDPHKWLDHFFDIRGTLLKEISVRVGLCVLWATLVVSFHRFVQPVGMSSLLHSLVGIALGLLLVFRTNASYDRYWEGRRLWGGIVNESRNLVRSATVYLSADRDLLHALTRWAAVFPWGVIASLRGEFKPASIASELSVDEMTAAANAQHPALYAAMRMGSCLQQARERGLITDVIQVALDRNIELLIGYVGGCERIRKTPLPFAYVVHLRRALVIYCYTLPFALVESFGWFTILDVLFVAYTFFGIEEIGVEIEGPFGYDENDLPMEDISERIRHNIYALAGMSHAQREVMPEGL